MNKKLLVALDNSEYAKNVMQKALELAKLHQASLLAISVIDTVYLSGCDECEPYLAETKSFWTASYQAIIDECTKLADQSDINYEHVIREGNPAEEIIKFSEQNDVEFIIVGHLGKSAKAGFLIGSVAQKIAAFSKCSVFIVK